MYQSVVGALLISVQRMSGGSASSGMGVLAKPSIAYVRSFAICVQRQYDLIALLDGLHPHLA
jgi:hypothetical protein